MKNGLYVDENGTQEWYLNEVRHRVDGPTYVEANGDQNGSSMDYFIGQMVQQLNMWMGIRHGTSMAGNTIQLVLPSPTQMVTESGGWKVLNTVRKNLITF